MLDWIAQDPWDAFGLLAGIAIAIGFITQR
jgi:ElaB/YqjD/DUF883 family membrane-anchored ribosome-binding protein